MKANMPIKGRWEPWSDKLDKALRVTVIDAAAFAVAKILD